LRKGEERKRYDALAVLRALGLDSGLIEDTPEYAFFPLQASRLYSIFLRRKTISYTAMNILGYEKKYK
jgi:hypothetical protein